MPSKHLAVRKAVRDKYVELAAPDVLVTLGHPGPGNLPNDVVSVMAGRFQQEPAAMSPQRPREEEGRIRLWISCERGGGLEAQEETADAAMGLLALLETALKTDPSLGGVVRYMEVTLGSVDEPDDADATAEGRWTDIEAEIRYEVRI